MLMFTHTYVLTCATVLCTGATILGPWCVSTTNPRHGKASSKDGQGKRGVSIVYKGAK